MHYLATNYNNQDKVCFLFNNTDSHISSLTAYFVFQALERRKNIIIINYTIQLHLYFLISLCLLLYFNRYNTMYGNGNTE